MVEVLPIVPIHELTIIIFNKFTKTQNIPAGKMDKVIPREAIIINPNWAPLCTLNRLAAIFTVFNTHFSTIRLLNVVVRNAIMTKRTLKTTLVFTELFPSFANSK